MYVYVLVIWNICVSWSSCWCMKQWVYLQEGRKLGYGAMQGIPMIASSPVRHESPLGMNPIEVQSYQPPWKALSDFALHTDLDRLDPSAPPFQQLVNQVSLLYLTYWLDYLINSRFIYSTLITQPTTFNFNPTHCILIPLYSTLYLIIIHLSKTKPSEDSSFWMNKIMQLQAHLPIFQFPTSKLLIIWSKYFQQKILDIFSTTIFTF